MRVPPRNSLYLFSITSNYRAKFHPDQNMRLGVDCGWWTKELLE